MHEDMDMDMDEETRRYHDLGSTGCIGNGATFAFDKRLWMGYGGVWRHIEQGNQ